MESKNNRGQERREGTSVVHAGASLGLVLIVNFLILYPIWF